MNSLLATVNVVTRRIFRNDQRPTKAGWLKDKAVAATGIGYRASRTIEYIGGAPPAWDSPVSTNPWRS
jgi:hypothetical protein